MEEGTQALERALEEIEDIHIPAPQVETVRSAPPKEEAPALPEKPAGETLPVPDDVKELTEKFMEQKERNDRKEATPAQMAAYQAILKLKREAGEGI